VFCHEAPDIDSASDIDSTSDIDTDVITELRQFGEIDKFYKTSDPGQTGGAWGTVTFTSPHSAAVALNANISLFHIEPMERIASTAPSNQRSSFDYTVRVTAVRRPLRGFGFVEFDDPEDLQMVIALFFSFTV